MIHPYVHYPARAAERWPEKVAVIDGDVTLTYAELDRRARALAAGMRACGVRAGERVAIVHENTHRYVEAVSAVARAGGVLVPLLGALSDEEHAAIAADAQPALVIALSAAGAERALRLRASLGAGSGPSALPVIAPAGADGSRATAGAHGAVHDYAHLLAVGGADLEPLDADPDDLGQILYTSGTTGRPKGVMHSLRSTSAGMGAWVDALALRHDDRLLGHFSLSHFGGRVMDASWCVGATLVILPRPDPEAILAAITVHGITVLLLVPTLMQTLLDQLALADADVTSLRVALYAAAPASASLVRRALHVLGPVIMTGFGQTEAYGPNTLLSAAEHRGALEAHAERLASIGREAAAWVQVRLLGEDGAPVARGEVGELCIAAPWVMRGYWRRPDLTEQTLRRGWLHTRDLGRQDADGYFYLVDRADDMIITGGHNVAPREVEDVIAALAGVEACCVVGAPHPKWGEAVTAVVVARDVTRADVVAHCKAHLAAFKVPKHVELAASLPRSGVGKILRRAVRERFWAGRERRVHGAE